MSRSVADFILIYLRRGKRWESERQRQREGGLLYHCSPLLPSIKFRLKFIWLPVCRSVYVLSDSVNVRWGEAHFLLLSWWWSSMITTTTTLLSFTKRLDGGAWIRDRNLLAISHLSLTHTHTQFHFLPRSGGCPDISKNLGLSLSHITYTHTSTGFSYLSHSRSCKWNIIYWQ